MKLNRSRSLVVGCAAALSVVACTGADRLTVRNLTTVAIAWNVADTPQYVPACATVKYIWDAGWRPVDPSDAPSPVPSDAVPIAFPSLPGDAHRPDAVVITETGVNVFVGDTLPSNGPCAGVPRSIDIAPSPSSTSVPDGSPGAVTN